MPAAFPFGKAIALLQTNKKKETEREGPPHSHKKRNPLTEYGSISFPRKSRQQKKKSRK